MNTIVIVDDHPTTREGLSIRINLENDLQLVGEAADVTDGIELIRAKQPDLAIIDISLKTGHGMDLIKQVIRNQPAVKILVWSMHDELLFAERVLRAGASGYLNKENATDTIVGAIRTVLKGEIYLSSKMSSKVLCRAKAGKTELNQSPIQSLSNRELQTFELIGMGHNTVEIANRMKLSPKTIETYRARIKEKIDVKDMAELTREATRWVLEL